jgi:hypothetical protein
MTNSIFIVAGSYSIAIAAVIGLIRLPRLHKAYQPFILINVLSFLNEIISHILIVNKKSNAAAVNIFGFFDAILWLWQFNRWTTDAKYKRALAVAAMFLMIIWLAENVFCGKLFVFGSVYAITFSFAMVILSTIQLSAQTAREKGSLLVAPKFMICSGVVLFYTYRIFVECFYAPGMSKSGAFYSHVFVILSIVNFVVNLLFALAVLWIPEKQKFSLPYY